MPVVINDSNYRDFINPVVDGEMKSHGLVPRDYSTHPMGCFAWAEPFPDSMLIPEVEWPERLAEQQANKASLLDIREAAGIHSLDQDGYGYCWAFSSTKAVMYLRARMNLPTVVLSGWSVGCLVKNYRNEGGWGGDSLDFIVKNGVASLDLFPGPKRQYDTPAMRANMVLHKVTEWYEGSDNPEKAFHQSVSAHLLGLPTIEDFDWWSHSVNGVAYMGNGKKAIDNSWTDSAGENGIFILEGKKAYPNGLWIPRVSTAALV